MKVALVYTSTTPELIEPMEKEVGAALPTNMEVASYQDPSILAEARDVGCVMTPPVARLAGVYMKAITEGADMTLNLRLSVGEVADAVQDTGRSIGVPIVRVGEETCGEVVRQGRRIGVMVTFSTASNPTKNTILRAAGEMNRRVELVDALVDEAFGFDQKQFKTLMSWYAREAADQVDVTLFAQGPMAYCEEYIHEKYGKVALPNPRFGVVILKDALVGKGLL